MNTIDDRITAALRARAELLTEAELSPAAPPAGRWAQPSRGRWTAPLLAAAIVGVAAVATVTAVQMSRSDHAHPAIRPTVSVHPSPSGVAPTPSASNPAPSQSATQPAPSQSPSQTANTSQSATPPPSSVTPPFVMGYEPLWPFGSYTEAEQWRTKAGGSQPWHLDAAQTALNFTRSYLGFTELDQVAEPRMDEQGAHVGVGYRDPNGQLRIAAVLHLIRYGDSKDSPWEVVGSDDTTLSLEKPAYGSRVSSPMTIGGHITGVDENIVVSVLASQTDRSTVAQIPAGGDRSAWTTGPVSFAQRGTLTLVASTGGHLQQVERFAIHGVHT
ncbi:MAG TPA: hypothetical protein VGX49_01795 [Jatrophihabitans sp.]|jgi:hypothetical protein|nr:hypothetical protein [Jatrophihabitans sp.]